MMRKISEISHSLKKMCKLVIVVHENERSALSASTHALVEYLRLCVSWIYGDNKRS